MKPYSLLPVILLLGLLLHGFEGRTQSGQPSAADDLVKGAIWTATAKRIWADTKSKQPLPKPWAMGTEFTKWVNSHPDDKSEIGLLRAAVIERIGKGKSGTASQVVDAILGEVAQRRQSKTGALARVKVETLQAELSGFVVSTPVESAPSPAPTTAAGAVASAPTAAPLEYHDTVPETSAAAPTVQVASVIPTSYLEQHPYQAYALFAVLGGLIGAGIIYWVVRAFASSPQETVYHDRNTSKQIDAEQDAWYKAQNEALTKKNTALSHRIRELEEQHKLMSSPAPPEAEPAPLPIPTPPLDDPAEPETEAASAPPTVAAPLHRYGPVQETPFIEERKIVDTPLPQLTLMLTCHPQDPDHASFTLNPHVNQSMLIGDGLTRLQKFFDYDPPVGRISSVTAAAAGQLQRQADGWQVVERARLLIT